jgi:hypothetical protein
MRRVEQPAVEAPDLELAASCVACGGDLSVRVRPGSARSVCRGCGAWSAPQLSHHDGELHMVQAAGAQA